MQLIAQNLLELFRPTKVLIVDDEFYTRKVIRTLLLAIGINNIYDADDGPSGLNAIRAIVPDVVLLDWQMPGMNGADFVKAVRSPGSFPFPNVPIIMLTGHGERWRVVEALRLGVNEYLLKPVSSKTLLDRMISILTKPRPIVKVGKYYGPEPRRGCAYKPVNEASLDDIVLIN
jgi:two-component system, chemotaxis family, chemotaxis protein CheY